MNQLCRRKPLLMKSRKSAIGNLKDLARFSLRKRVVGSGNYPASKFALAYEASRRQAVRKIMFNRSIPLQFVIATLKSSRETIPLGHITPMPLRILSDRGIHRAKSWIRQQNRKDMSKLFQSRNLREEKSFPVGSSWTHPS